MKGEESLQGIIPKLDIQKIMTFFKYGEELWVNELNFFKN